jgi:hypoxanthine phosphoribosyltransferase
MLRCTFADIEGLVRDRAVELAAFAPDVIVAIGGGGFIPARILRTLVPAPILAVSVELYAGQREAGEEVSVKQWFDAGSGTGALLAGGRVLVVDDVNDTGTTLEYVTSRLLRENAPAAVAAFVVHDKAKSKIADVPEDVRPYVVGQHTPNVWIRYPWDALADVRTTTSL